MFQVAFCLTSFSLTLAMQEFSYKKNSVLLPAYQGYEWLIFYVCRQLAFVDTNNLVKFMSGCFALIGAAFLRLFLSEYHMLTRF